MVALPQTYQTKDLPDSGGAMPLIAPGQYPAVIVHSEMKATSAGDGQYLALKVVLTQGQFKGTEFTERLNIVNKNLTAVEIAYKTLARISEAVGMTQTPSDSVQLHNKPFFVQIETEAGKPYTGNDGQQKQGKDKSIIKKYLATPGAGTPTPFNPAFPDAPFPPVATATPAATPPANNPFAPPK